jgi:alanyl-tRNA synthetase
MNRKELIKKYLEFFESKKHKVIPSSSLIPENDPTVLFTTAGMHPLVPFLLGEKHPLGKRLCDVQKCIRTGDIDDVGDDIHLTFFEMLGNWSLGDYWKKEAIEYSFEFLTKILKIPKERLAVSCFAGDDREKQVPRDEEAAKVWLGLGIKEERIAFLKGGIYESKNNWWGPAGTTGPCGPDTEMFYYVGEKVPAKFSPEDKKWVEIWNDVLMQYNKDEKGNYNSAKQKNIDTGMGVERTLAVLQGKEVYETDCFLPIIKEIEKISGKKYKSNEKSMRIIADHIKAAVMILGDDKHLKPGNNERGYVLRRLIRRAIRYARELGINENFASKLAVKVIEIYEQDYQELKRNRNFILTELDEEENRFRKVIEDGFKEFDKIVKGERDISGKNAFLLYQSFGFPIEMTQELAEERGLKVNMNEYKKAYNEHQELSKTASAGMFKSGLADNSEATTKLHTATHLLNQALREVLGKKEIFQRGSNITPERLRFDFNFDRKLTNEELEKIDDWVNARIKEKIDIKKEEMSIDEAKKKGAQGVFESKYGEKVSVFSIGNKSIEICAGPHVSNTSQLGHFKIIKEESSSAGVRRIKAKLLNEINKG